MCLSFNIQHPTFNIIYLRLFIIILIFTSSGANAQTLGGNATYNFLKLPATPLLTAAGGVNVSYQANEVGLSSNNPSLLDSTMDTQVNVSFNSFLAGIKTYALSGARHIERM